MCSESILCFLKKVSKVLAWKILHPQAWVTKIGVPGEWYEGFPGSSAGKESACNAGDPSLIPGLGRSAGEGIGYPLQYS